MGENQFLATSVAQTEDWDFAGGTQYLTHALHPYLASMIPQISSRLLSMYAKPGMTLLDPFTGGGSVIVEAYLAGLIAKGLDINPLGVLIAKAKTTFIPLEVLQDVYNRFEAIFPSIEFDVPSFSEQSQITYWFKPYMFEPLAQIRNTIHKIVETTDIAFREKVKVLLECIFSHTVRSVSLTYRNEVRLRRLEPKDLERFNPNIYSEFKKRLLEAVKRVSQLPDFPHPPLLAQGDARRLEFANKEFDMVITSPPYGDLKNTIPYHQFSKNMLYWLGWTDEAIAYVRHNSLGSRSMDEQKFPFMPSFQDAISQMKKASAISEAILFYNDYYRTMHEIGRVTSQRVVIVVGHRVLNDVFVDNPAITSEIMNELGWVLEARYDRRIKFKRLNKKMGMASNFQGATIDREAILVYTPI